jgi:glucans biosynthesis protein C
LAGGGDGPWDRVRGTGLVVGGAAAPAATPATARLPWVDNLKLAVIAGVVVVHAATAYILDIDWYYDTERSTSQLWGAVLSLPVLLGAMFGLGPLFLLGGVFAATALARRGPSGFVHGRLLRLGVPLVLFVAFIDPLTGYLGDLAEDQAPGLWGQLAPSSKARDVGPLWFVAALLTFSLVYAAWRWWRPAGGGGKPAERPRQLLVAAVVIAVGSFAVRLRWPWTGDTFLVLRWPEWPQGAALFTLGVVWGERGWLGRMPVAWSHRCGRLATAGLAAMSLLVAVTSMADEELTPLLGGWHLQSLAFAVLEGAVAVSLSLWLVGWSRRRWADQGRLAARASRGAYAAYVLHAPVLVLVSLVALPLPLPPEAKFFLVAPVGVVAAFTAGWAVTRSALIARFV